MKRFLIMLKLCSALVVLSMGLATASFAQGSFGAGAIILTDPRGHQLTIVPPIPGSPEYDAWAAVGFQNILWGIPIPPTDTSQGAFIYSGPMNGFTLGPVPTTRTLAYWVPPGQLGIHNTGGHAGAWDWASATDLGLITSTGPLEGNLNVITDPAGNITTMPNGAPNTVLHSGTPPAWGQVANADLVNSSVTVSPGTGLSGGGSVSLGGTTTLNLANTLVTPNPYGDATHTAAFTVDQQGRLTAASNVLITGVTPGGTAGGDLTGTYPDPTIANTAGNNIIAALNNAAATSDPLFLPVDMQITGSHSLGVGGPLTAYNGFYSGLFSVFGEDVGGNPGLLTLHDATAGNGKSGTIRTVDPLTNVWTWTLPDKSGTFAMLTDITGGTQSGSFTTLYSSGNSEIGNTSAAIHNMFGTAANAAGVLNEIGSVGAGSMTIVNGGFTLNSLAGTNGILQATTGVVSTGNLSGDVTTTNSLVTTINNTTGAGNHIVAALNSPATAKSMNADVFNYDATMHVASHAIGVDLSHANTWTGTQTFPSQVYAPSDGTIGNPIQNNWALPANNTYFRISSAAPADLTGIAAGTAGQILILMNVGANVITMKDLNVLSSASNQFDLGGGDILLGPKGSIMLIYDGGFSKWMIVRY